MRPRGLSAMTATMTVMALSGLLFWRPSMSWLATVGYLTTPVLSIPVLWRFWSGKNWARWVVMLSAVILAIPNALLVLVLAPREPPHGPGFPGWQWLLVIEGMFGVGLVVWLWRPRVREYFRRRAPQSADSPDP